ncbi:MAG: hypothetical protein K2X77_09215 [Candidatus Obscuribacterales bacterium]|jgi:hypothetical protein|nr:hypothetical protein [Candidatus Obscuribacterales bacterium]
MNAFFAKREFKAARKFGIVLASSIFLAGQFAPGVYAEQAYTPPTAPSAIDVTNATPHDGATSVPESVMTGLNSATTFSGMNIIDFGTLSGGHLDFGSGNFSNAAGGILYAISTNPTLQNAQLSALNIYNAGTITTIIPTGGLPGYNTANLVQGLNLSINAIQNIVNTGSITSAGSLSVTAPAIYNALPSTAITTVAPVMSAMQSMNLQTNALVNSGMLVSQLANLNIVTNATGNLSINSLGGTLQALNGTINIGQSGTQTVLQNLEINGGNFLTNQLNVLSDNGLVNIATQSLVGALNINAGEAHVRSSGDLRIGNVTVTNDPSFEVDDNGNIILTGDIVATDEITGNVVLHAGNSILNEGASKIIAPGAGYIDMRASQNIVLDGLAFMGTDGGQIGIAAENGSISWEIGAGTLHSGGGDVSLKAGQNVSISGLQSVTTENGFFSVEAENGNIIWGSDAAVVTTGEGMVNVLAKQNILATNISINAEVPDAGKVGFLALEGSLDLSGTSIRSTFAPATFAGGLVQFPPSSVLLAAPGDLTVGNITSPAGSVFVAAGAFISEEEVPGFPPGTLFVHHQRSVGNLKVGNVNIDSETKTGNGTIMMTTGIGDISAGDLSGNGSRLWVFTNSGNVKVGSVLDASRKADDVPGQQGAVFPHVDVRLVTREGNLDVQGPVDVSGGSALFESVTGGGVTISTPVLAREKFGNPVDLQIKGDLFATVAGSIDLVSSDSQRGVNRVLVAANTVQTGNIDANGAGNADAGVIRVTANTINTGILNLTANGAGTGAGGSIQVLTGEDLNVTGSGIIRANARGGEAGGNGGAVYFASGGHLTVNKSVFDVSPAGTSGKGGSIYLEGDTIEIQNNSLNADGKGTSSGGEIFVTARSRQPLSFSDGSDMPKLFARSGQDGGTGGKIVIQSGGNLRVDSTHVHVDARGEGIGDGGYLSFTGGSTSQTAFSAEDRQSGSLTINGNLSANGHGEAGYGGTIKLQAYGIAASDGGGGPIGSFALVPGPDAEADGQIQINGSLNVNGGSQAAGGFIEIHAETNRTSDGKVLSNQAGVQLGDETKSYAIRADGGILGGGINIYSNGKIFLNANTVSASATKNGSGGNISVYLDPAPVADDGGGVIIGAFAANFAANAAEDSAVANASFRVNGAGSGNGGTVQINTAEGSVSISSPSTVAIQANSGGDDGIGGSISLNSGVDFTLSGALQAKGFSSGGQITVTAKHQVSMLANAIDVRATQGDAGNITLSAINGSLLVQSDLISEGGGSGNGGNIKLFAGNDLVVGQAVQLTSINAQGGKLSGNGGTLDFKSGGFTELHTGTISTVSRGESGNGGNFTVNSTSGLSVGGQILSESRAKVGNGGDVTLNTESGDLTVQGDLHLGANNGIGGSLSIDPPDNVVLGKIDSRIKQDGRPGNIFIEAINTITIDGADLKSMEKTQAPPNLILVAGGDITSSDDILLYAFEGPGASLYVHSKNGNISIKDVDTHSLLPMRADDKTIISDGGFVVLQAGKNISTGSIKTYSSNGSAGSVFISANKLGDSSATPFAIGNGGTNGINGYILASGWSRPTKADVISTGEYSEHGYVFIQDSGAGISVNSKEAFRTSTLTSAPLAIILDAPNGTISINEPINNDGFLGGGQVVIQAKTINLTALIETTKPLLSANSTGFGDGGYIVLSGESISFDNTTVASKGALGGNVFLVTKENSILQTNDQYAGESPPRTLGSSIGVRAVVTRNIVGNLFLQGQGNLAIDTTGTVKGGRITAAADTLGFGNVIPGHGIYSFNSNGSQNGSGGRVEVFTNEWTILSNLDFQASGKGGGVVVVECNDTPLSIGGVNFLINAGGGRTNSESINQIVLTSNESITIHGNGIALGGTQNRDAGLLAVDSKEGTIEFRDVLQMNGAGTGRGGEIIAIGSKVLVSNGAFLSVNGGVQGGDGGKITLQSTSQNRQEAAITIEGAEIHADGGSSLGGRGGVVRFVGLGFMTLDEVATVSAIGRGGREGGKIEFSTPSAGTELLPGNLNLFLDGTLITRNTDTMGSITFSASTSAEVLSSINVQGGVVLSGAVSAGAGRVKFDLTRDDERLNIRSIVASAANTPSGDPPETVIVRAIGDGSTITILSPTTSAPAIQTEGPVLLTGGNLIIGTTISEQHIISASDISLITNNNGAEKSVVFSGGISGRNIVIGVAGNGNINQTTQSFSAITSTGGGIDISLQSGSMGSSASPVRIQTERLSIIQSATSNKSIHINANSSSPQELSITEVGAVGLVDITNNGSIEIGTDLEDAIVTDSLILTASNGGITVSSELDVSNLTLRTFGTGNIILNENVKATGHLLINIANGTIEQNDPNTSTPVVNTLGLTASGTIGSAQSPFIFDANKLSVSISEGSFYGKQKSEVSSHTLRLQQISITNGDFMLLADGTVSNASPQSQIFASKGTVTIDTRATQFSNVGSTSQPLHIVAKSTIINSSGSVNVSSNQGGSFSIRADGRINLTLGTGFFSISNLISRDSITVKAGNGESATSLYAPNSTPYTTNSASVLINGSKSVSLPTQLVGLNGVFHIQRIGSNAISVGIGEGATISSEGTAEIRSGVADPFQPIGFIESSPPSLKASITEKKCRILSRNALVTHDGDSTFELETGEILLQCKASLEFHLERGLTLKAKEGTILMLSKADGVVCIKNLSDTRQDSLHLAMATGEHVFIRPGEIVEISNPGEFHDNENLGFRYSRIVKKTNDYEIWIAEFPLAHLLCQNDLISTVRKSEHRSILESVYKMSACLQVLRNKNGPFVRVSDPRKGI